MNTNPTKTCSIGIAGDLMLCDSPLFAGSGVRSQLKGDYGRPFLEVPEWFRSLDALIANLEGVVVPTVRGRSPSQCAMKIPSAALKVLNGIGLSHVSVANNHTMEYGPEPFKWMCTALRSAGIEPFGLRDQPFLVTQVKGVQIGLIAFSTVPALYGHRPEYFYLDPADSAGRAMVCECIKECASQCDHVIVFPHWGTEFMDRATACQVALAKDLVECGAKLISGAHPHVVQDAWRCGNSTVFPSLGDLVSDYPQERMRRTAVLQLDCDPYHIEVNPHIWTRNAAHVLRETSLPYLVAPEPPPAGILLSDAEYASEANKRRLLVRRELLTHVLRSSSGVLSNPGLAWWLLRRFLWLHRHRRRIAANPREVYNGPIH